MNRLVLALVFAAAAVAPVSADIPTKIYAQQLVDDTVAKNADLLVVAMHVTPPKTADDNIVIASNIGRIGTRSGPDDLHVIETNAPRVALLERDSRLDVELVLKDTSGANVGALDLTFAYAAGAQRAAFERRAQQIRDGLARQILNATNLFDPYPIDPAATTKTHAQRLVDRAMAQHPEVLSLALHLTLPESGENVILGSSFGRIGKKADDDDMKVIRTGQAAPGLLAGGTRFGSELPLQDANGKTVGALSVAYAYKAGDDRAVLAGRAEKLRDELRKQFETIEQLVALDP